MSALDASKLEITKTTTPKEPLANDKLVFGQSFTDHILEIDWTKEEGWGTPKITPYHNFQMDPATCVLHYSFELFEGMKAYRDSQGKIRTFRPDKNMERMNRTAKRASLPTFDGEEFIKLLDKFLALEERFVPQGKGYSLYLRPTLIGTSIGLGVSSPTKAKLYCIASPVGPYFGAGFKPVSLEATDYAVRAWPKGVGAYKLGANYVSCIEPQSEAAKRGHSQNLWLFGEEGEITEVGAMNVFFAFENDDKTKELVTAPLDGMILPGVTRDSAIQLARARLDSKEWSVSERKLTIHEVKERAAKGQLIEAFGTGTAAIVAPINNIEFRGENIEVPCTAGGSGEIAKNICEWIQDIQYGVEEFENWSRVAN
ncbi:Mitochondrial branched-chain amino acid (BCAA) aminotransferase [Lodderomyces elongisporus]|uniref:Branched-chain-amino-acid aminotransferase n=1 Tax=Lodderomyces elongisporus (strain ATCC 11503 / CBS 2605 / JCM 1781 / NBRC 1676 / NRRL YB-4239) TaxID=379508 RepID=A5DY11_LODEL|nr:Mitochondrial branched-chain amino acid (BCAA) aminotransferase [Lodderomyces elongisporus]EDK44069.1 branched-chain-amino-acid aminotransferase, mitochondrial precursor [Lodderomyces elongisporus NRRL YB-4239]WLF78528.1 Mitochondrial branched-chain amino acid (BCAA) aminotransferase [Lodderomyces elongisporus]